MPSSPNVITETDTYAEFFFAADSDDEIVLPDGPWEFLMFSRHVRDTEPSPRARAAVSVSDLLGLVVSSYDAIDDDDEAFMARYYAAREIAGEVQAVVNAQAIDSPARPDLTAPECDVLWAEKDQPAPVGHWDGPAPLVLVRTDYSPFTDVAAPTGAILWIDPSDERSMVESMQQAGYVQLSVKTDEA